MMKAALFALAIALGGAAYADKACCPVGAPATQKAESAPINQKCPVEGGKVNPAVTVQHEGKTIGFCCEGCIAKFQADPAKYGKNLEKAG